MLYGEQFGTRPSLSVAAAILRKLRWSITFQELPPNFATFILTKPTAGRQGAATICPPALEPREVPHFPETTSVQQTITPLAGKERPRTCYGALSASAAPRSSSGCRGRIYTWVSRLSLHCCCWELALHTAQSASPSSPAVPGSTALPRCLT